jgi:hypothetical protein
MFDFDKCDKEYKEFETICRKRELEELRQLRNEGLETSLRRKLLDNSISDSRFYNGLDV